MGTDDTFALLLVKAATLAVVGVAGGFINTVAGGASLLCMPVLAWLGLPANAANATNNLATTAQSLFSAASFARRGFRDLRLVAILALPAVAGAVLGSWFVVELPERAFSRIVGLLMLGTLVLVLKKPRPKGRTERPPLRRGAAVGGVALFGVLGIYGGFFGGGLGLMMLPLLVLLFDLDLVTGNSVKTALSFVMNLTATFVFVAHGLVHLAYAIPLTAGMLVGARLGVTMSIAGGDAWIRRFLVVITLVAAAWFLLR
ncbi:MAG: hypothetical protein AMXMBFR64_36720 [Myxococcales bacterium]